MIGQIKSRVGEVGLFNQTTPLPGSYDVKATNAETTRLSDSISQGTDHQLSETIVVDGLCPQGESGGMGVTNTVRNETNREPVVDSLVSRSEAYSHCDQTSPGSGGSTDQVAGADKYIRQILGCGIPPQTDLEPDESPPKSTTECDIWGQIRFVCQLGESNPPAPGWGWVSQ